jgi:hypothetical protein
MTDTARTSKNRRTIALSVTVVLTIVVVAYYLTFPPIRGDVPCFRTRGLGHSGRPDCLLRLDAEGNLLLAPPDPSSRLEVGTHVYLDGTKPLSTPTYRYLRAEETLEPVSEAVWEDATGTIAEMPHWRPPPDWLRIEDGRLWNHDDVVPLAGRSAIKWSIDPTETVLAVLSANGLKRPEGWSPMPFLAGGRPEGYLGQHYIDFFNFPSLTPKEQPTRVPPTTAKNIIRLRWSVAGEYLVLWQTMPETVCVIPLDEVDNR